jgi:hypothetical protein
LNYWIFQSLADRYDLRDPSKIRQGGAHFWYTSRYRTEMNPGDVVFFWLAGDPDYRGIYGWGELTSTPYVNRDGAFVVDIVFKERLENYISVHEIVANPELADLLILRIPIGANFLITRPQARAIARLIKPPDIAPKVVS